MKTFSDHRGEILDFEDGTQFITSLEDSVRANHWHKTSGHTCILTRGRIMYYERPVGSIESPEVTLYEAPASFYTGPNLEHSMVFLEDSEMVCIRKGGSFNHDEYESDLVRLTFNLEEQE
jgi:hypothetical protein